MQLFKRILLSLFPKDMVNQAMNPASMFVSFISARQFFSVINRRIIENYKLNLFDISLDPFDVKIGFGERPTINVRDIDIYYSYGVVANFNGYKFLSPANLGNTVAMISSLYFKNSFKKDEYEYFSNIITSIYLLSFLFIARLKVFPYKEEKDNYNWFIELFFEFYSLVSQQNMKNFNQEKFDKIKINVLSNIQVFFMLFHLYKSLNNIFVDTDGNEIEFYNYLFYEELKKGKNQEILTEFIKDYEFFTRTSKFSTKERKIINLVIPADILIRYIFDGEDIFSVVDYVISQVYDKSKVDTYMSSFLTSDKLFEEFIEYITDYKLFKSSYFKGLKKFVINKFKASSSYEEEENIDDFISRVGEMDSLDNIKIPDRIKKESALMERFINFYITFLGGFEISRGDNFFIRLFRKDILKKLVRPVDTIELKQDALFFYGGLLYNYGKNVFYYNYAYDSVKAGRDKFNLPFKSTAKEVYSNMFIIKLFDENFITTLLQDIYLKDIKLYIQNKEILKEFKNLFGKKISSIVKLSNKSIVEFVYGNIQSLLNYVNNFQSVLEKTIKEKDILNLKESIYTLDFWLWIDLLERIKDKKIDFGLRYSDFSIIGVLANFRDTLLGFLIYMKYSQDKIYEQKPNVRLSVLKKVYLLDVIGISEDYFDVFNEILDSMLEQYHNLAINWINLDDNEQYLRIGAEDWKFFCGDKKEPHIFSEISGEDIIWFKGYLKNITFYNKRYLIPKD